MWDIKSFSSAPQCSRVKTEKARGGERKAIKRRSGRVSESGKKRREEEMRESERRGGNGHFFELIVFW